MGNKSFAIALVFSLISLPLACSGDDDDDINATGGKSGSGGEGGDDTSAGKSGGGKSGGKGGTAGTAGSTPGGAGEGGSGNSGNVGGEAGGGAGGQAIAGGGAGGESGGGGGGAQGGSGSGGEGGASDPGAAARQVKCEAICTTLVFPVYDDPTTPAGPCTAPSTECSEPLCDTTGFDSGCIQTLEDLLTCIQAAPQMEFCCGDCEHGLEGRLEWDLAAEVDPDCSELKGEFAACRAP